MQQLTPQDALAVACWGMQHAKLLDLRQPSYHDAHSMKGGAPVVSFSSHARMGEAQDGSKAVAGQVALAPTPLPARCCCLLQHTADTA